MSEATRMSLCSNPDNNYENQPIGREGAFLPLLRAMLLAIFPEEFACAASVF